MTKSFLKLWSLLTIGHLFILGILFFYGFDLSSIDTGVPSPLSKQIAYQAAGVLLMPLRVIWTGWMSKNMPNLVEWLSVVLNSALWGVVIAFLFSKFKKSKGNRYAA